MSPRDAKSIWVAVAAGFEVLVGVALFASPSLLTRLLFGSDLTPPGQEMGRVAGLALLGLALACLPRPGARETSTATIEGLLLLSVLVTAYLVYLGLSAASVGVLLWPAAATHIVLAILLARVWINKRRAAP
jgi:hypothetical protein